MTPERIAELRELAENAMRYHWDDDRVSEALTEMLDAIERVRALADKWADYDSPTHARDIFAALEGKSE